MDRQPDDSSLGAVIFALFGGDAEVTRRILAEAGVSSEICTSAEELARAVSRGPGVLIVVEEALTPPCVSAIVGALKLQDSWSDLPIVVSAAEGRRGRESFGVLGALGEAGNVTILERPVRVRAMVSAVSSALRARRRQYATRDLLVTLAANESMLARLATAEAEARAEAEALSRSKDEFLATVSHELRTPLNAILGWARMLIAGRLDASTSGRALQAVERNAVAQAKLIEDLLDVSRIISGKLVIAFEEVSLRKVLEAAVDTVKPALDGKEIRLTVELDPAADDVMGDPTRLQQIVWNLLSNAAKFTPKGGHVSLRLRRVAAEVELTVSDDGQGIDASFLPRVFRRFHQEDGSTTRRHSGLGLGLAICRQLIELHGGTIEARSRGVGLGSEFTVRLPHPDPAGVACRGNRPSERKREPTSEGVLRDVSVLVVDDEADARELLVAVLEDAGACTIEATGAVDALERVRSELPNLIVSDVGMPGHDGHWLLRQVRALPASEGGSTPAVALTAYASASDRRKAVDAGFELHMPKPVHPDELVAALAILARMGRGVS